MPIILFFILPHTYVSMISSVFYWIISLSQPFWYWIFISEIYVVFTIVSYFTRCNKCFFLTFFDRSFHNC